MHGIGNCRSEGLLARDYFFPGGASEPEGGWSGSGVPCRTLLDPVSRPKVGPRSAQGQPKVGPKSTQSWPKVGPKSTQIWPQGDPKSAQSLPKVGPESAQDTCRMRILILQV